MEFKSNDAIPQKSLFWLQGECRDASLQSRERVLLPDVSFVRRSGAVARRADQHGLRRGLRDPRLGAASEAETRGRASDPLHQQLLKRFAGHPEYAVALQQRAAV